MLKKQQWINQSTGQIVNESTQVVNDTFTEDGYRFPWHKKGARLFDDVQFPAEMTDADIGKMTRLSKLMISKTNALGYRQGRKIMAYNINELCHLLDMSYKGGWEFIHKMFDLHVMLPIKTSSETIIYINPAYFMANGQRLSLDLFLLFKEELAPIVPAWVMDSFLRQALVKQTGKFAYKDDSILSEAEKVINDHTHSR